MMKIIKLIALFFLFGIYSSCNNDDNDTPILSGVYIETTPVSGRSQLNFVNTNTVVLSEPDNSTEDEFTYVILDNLIKLTPAWDNTNLQEFEIEIINSSKFKIENLYPSVGINPTTYMTFEK